MSDAAGVSHWALPALELTPERVVPRRGRLDEALAGAIAWAATRRPARCVPIVERVRARECEMRALADEGLRAAGARAGAALRCAEDWPAEAVAPVLAAVAEGARRRLGIRAHDVQIQAAAEALRGRAVEMATGEGKTLVAVLAACAAALGGLPVHVVTVNSYLAGRDAAFGRPVCALFGLTSAAVTEGMDRASKQRAYACDIAVCVNKELAFDYMRDRLGRDARRSNLRRKAALLAGETPDGEGMLLRGLHFAIVDEADSILIDEARTPLILSGAAPRERDATVYDVALGLARALDPDDGFVLRTGERRAVLTARGREAVGRLAPSEAPWDQVAERERLVEHALSALQVLRSGEDYLVRDGRVEIVDEYTGRVLPDRAWSEDLHELVERKEGLALSARRRVLARMTYQRFFRRYRRLCGLSGTLGEVAAELRRTYDLRVVAIPPNLPDRKTVRPARGFATDAARGDAMAADVAALHRRGIPVLVGTRTVAASVEASRRFEAAGLPHVVLSAAQSGEEAVVIARAGEPGRITIATNMAGRGTDIRIEAEVAERGGLRVVLSEMQDARRIDRQLAGRCGRQGEPGEILVYASLEDPVFVRGLPRWATRAACRWMAADGEARWPVFLARAAQRMTERRHARIRRSVLRMDDWLDDATGFAGASE